MSILQREPAAYSSTYPSEVITCRPAGGRELQLYCKYLADLDHASFGHRGGLHYEMQVYRDVLGPLPISVPRYHGAFEDPANGHVGMILQYLQGSLRIQKNPRPDKALPAAARWIARFHSANESRLNSPALSFLKRYDARYYLGWVRRTARFSAGLSRELPWVKTLCRRFRECLPLLLSPPLTVIHGEFYVHNILTVRGVVYPVDWESTAVGAGEIDLATLAEGWEPEMAELFAQEYRRARWPDGPPDDFERRLAAAKLYLGFRWLGEHASWTKTEGNRVYFNLLRSAGEQLGLI